MIDNGKKVKVGNTISINEACANIDYNYGPYNSAEEAYEYLFDMEVIAIGRTVGIKTEEGIVEYWFKNGTELQDLVLKNSGGNVDTVVILAKLEEIQGAVEDIKTRMTAQEEAQESDEWDEL